MFKKILIVFVSALVLNIIWENAHVFLYDNYQGGSITQFILLRASLFDAILITLISLPFIYFTRFSGLTWLIIPLGIFIAILNEWYGLGTARWAYQNIMPIIPFIQTGLSPTLQLGLTGFLSLKIVRMIENV